jgi:hypothetical protein
MGVQGDQRGGDNALIKILAMESMVLSIAMMHEHAVQHTSLYKRQAASSS